jgi:hypothetical protein
MLTFIFLLLTSCFNQTFSFSNPPAMPDQHTLLVGSRPEMTVFYHATSKKFYFLQHKSRVTLPGHCGFVQYNDGVLTVKNQDTGAIVRFELNEQVYGIGTGYGSVLEAAYLVAAPGQPLALNPNFGPEPVKCGCLSNTVDTDSGDCDAGGEGSTGCTVVPNTPMDPAGGCTVTCGSGYYSCCLF